MDDHATYYIYIYIFTYNGNAHVYLQELVQVHHQKAWSNPRTHMHITQTQIDTLIRYKYWQNLWNMKWCAPKVGFSFGTPYRPCCLGTTPLFLIATLQAAHHPYWITSHFDTQKQHPAQYIYIYTRLYIYIRYFIFTSIRIYFLMLHFLN